MAALLDGISWLLIAGAGVFLFAGGIGVLRFPDFYSRTHPATITDTLGAALLLFAMMIQAGFSLVSVKLFLILLFLWLTSPTAGYALANSAWFSGLVPYGVKTRTARHKPAKPRKHSGKRKR